MINAYHFYNNSYIYNLQNSIQSMKNIVAMPVCEQNGSWKNVFIFCAFWSFNISALSIYYFYN